LQWLTFTLFVYFKYKLIDIICMGYLDLITWWFLTLRNSKKVKQQVGNY
jgi:hypothetical protein